MLTRNETETLTVESRTVGEALAAISDELGPDVEVVDARKVLRGGMGGFFAREMVQITARPAPHPAEGGSSHDLAVGTEEAGEVLFRDVLAGQMERSAVEIDLPPGAGDEDLRVTLRGAGGGAAKEAAVVAALMEGPPAPPPMAAPPEEAPPEPEPTPRPEPAAEQDGFGIGPGPSTARWRLEALLALRLPAGIVRACTGLAPDADLTWVSSIAAASAELCGNLDDRPAVVAGPGAHHLAATLGLPAVRCGDPTPEAGSFCATVHPDAAGRDWLAAALVGRSLHLVVSDHDWAPLLVERPVAVSWTDDRALPGALYLAAALGIPLGFGATAGFPVGVARVDPVEVALSIRRLARR